MNIKKFLSNYDLYLCFLVSIALFVIVSYCYIFSISPLNGEDFALTRVFDNEGIVGRVEWSFGRSITQVNSWNARLGEQLAIFWLSMPPFIYTVFAVVCLLVYSFLISILIQVKNTEIESDKLFGKSYLNGFLISISLIFPLWPSYELIFWRTVQAGYFQPLILTIFVMFFYMSSERILLLKNSKFLWAFVSLIAFFVGISFENVPIALFLFMFASVFFAKIENRHELISYKIALPILCLLIGWFLLYMAPSTEFRRSYYNQMFGVSSYSLQYILSRMINVINVFWTSSWVLLSITIASSFILIRFYEHKRYFIFIIAFCVLISGTVILAPYTEPRAFSVVWSIMMAVVVASVRLVLQNFKILIVVPCVVNLIMIDVSVNLYSAFNEDMLKRHYSIINNISSCERGIKIKFVSKNYQFNIINNRDEWYKDNLEQVGRYYGGCKISIEN